jgi:hypothetical protein
MTLGSEKMLGRVGAATFLPFLKDGRTGRTERKENGKHDQLSGAERS